MIRQVATASQRLRRWSQGLPHSAASTPIEATTWARYHAVLARAVSCPLRTSPSPWTRVLKESPPSMVVPSEETRRALLFTLGLSLVTSTGPLCVCACVCMCRVCISLHEGCVLYCS